ncbi:hypothetical protein OSB04_012574 [Centaurea solstitialis]|uniref:Uncharacterized protein n=1 Tax=Centaurea solstitialis TaxID=347529 RepID=A0AA38WMJ9_9ASTR|nr:hypothetical protein OSB04_012574 [Centaurea solstitialis]
MFQTQACTKRYDATRALNACKIAKGTSVSVHVMKMKRHIDHLERLDHPVPLQLVTDTILNSLSDDYKQFVINYNMNNMDKTIVELYSMLKTAELSMGTKTKDVLMVNGETHVHRRLLPPPPGETHVHIRLLPPLPGEHMYTTTTTTTSTHHHQATTTTATISKQPPHRPPRVHHYNHHHIYHH